MTDYLLVHGAGQGAWVWGRVWGLMTAPEEHPPRLHRNRKANRVFPIDLPGHGPDAEGDTAAVRLEECVEAINRAVEREKLKDLVLVGHGLAGSLVLKAATALPQPPKRIVLVAGVVPARHRSMISAYSQPARVSYHLLSFLSTLSRQELKLPIHAINRYLCNTMGPMEVVQNLGFFGPLPTRVLKTRISLDDNGLSSPITYVVLGQNRVISPEAQRQTAHRFGSEEVVEIEACHQVMLEKPEELADVLLRYA